MVAAQGEQVTQQRRHFLAAHLRESAPGDHFGQAGIDTAAPVLVGFLGTKAEVGLEHVDERRIAGQHVHLQATPFKPDRPFLTATARGRQDAQLADQPRLAHPRLTDDGHHPAPSPAKLGDGRLEARELRVPADQVGRVTLSPHIAPAVEQRMLDAIRRSGSQVSIQARELEGARGEPIGRFPGEDLARSSVPAEAPRRIGRRPE